MKLVRGLIIILIVGFCLFYMVRQPEAAAGSVRTVFDALGQAFSSIITFFTSLAG